MSLNSDVLHLTQVEDQSGMDLRVFTGPHKFWAHLFVYHKSLNTGRVSNTSRGSESDLIVPIEAGPQIQAGFQKLA